MPTEKIKIKKTWSVSEVLSQKTDTVPFTGTMYDAFGTPQVKGRWFVWGNSGSGKSSFVMQLAKEFARHTTVLYNNLEEDKDEIGFIDRIRLFQMQDVKHNIGFQQYNQAQLHEKLSGQKSPKVILIDSATYFWNTLQEYKDFMKRWRQKIVIVVGHADGSKPDTTLEEKIHRDANMKVFVEGYMATCKGRKPGPKGNYIIWKEGYDKIHGLTEFDSESSSE